ncbi:MAG: glycerophosphodiester phosphodiesterase family protein [Culicoidibacterales bacterium]
MIKKILKMTWYDIKHSWRKILPLAVVYRFVTLLLLLPFFSFVLNLVISGTSPVNLFNEFVFKRILLFSPIVIGLIFIFFVTIFVEQYCWMFISYQNRHQAKFSLPQALGVFKQQFKQLLPIIFIQTSLNFLVAFFIGSTLATSPIISRFRLPSFITDFIQQNDWLIIVYILISLVLIWLYMRTLFLTSIAIDSRERFPKILKQANGMLRGRIIYRTALFAIVQAAVAITIGVLVFGIQFVITEIIYVLPGLDSLQTLSVINTVVVIVTTGVSAIWSPIQAMLIQNFYACSKVEKGKPYPMLTQDEPRKSSKILWIIAIVSLVFSGIFTVSTDQMQATKPLVIAHRGAGNQPQNTIIAMTEAVKQGAQMIELDVQMTQDGVVVLEHDKTFNRAYGIDTSVPQTRYEEIKDLDAGRYFTGEPTLEKLATLAEVIQVTEASKTPLIIEIKSYDAEKEPLLLAINEVIIQNQCEDRCIIASTVYSELVAMEAINPHLFRIYIAYLAFGDFSDLDVDGFMIENTNLTKKAVQRVQAKQKVMFVWTLNTSEEVSDAWSKGVGGIITDNVPLVQDVYDTQARPNK